MLNGPIDVWHNGFASQLLIERSRVQKIVYLLTPRNNLILACFILAAIRVVVFLDLRLTHVTREGARLNRLTNAQKQRQTKALLNRERQATWGEYNRASIWQLKMRL